MSLIYSEDVESGLLWPHGGMAGTKDGSGYYNTQVGYTRLKNHRIIWEMYRGEIPEGMQIDHINGVRTDNRLENLRLVTPSENSRNRKKQANNTSGMCKLHVRPERNAIVVQWTDENLIRCNKTFGYKRKRTFEEALELATNLVSEVSKTYSDRHGK